MRSFETILLFSVENANQVFVSFLFCEEIIWYDDDGIFLFLRIIIIEIRVLR